MCRNGQVILIYVQQYRYMWNTLIYSAMGGQLVDYYGIIVMTEEYQSRNDIPHSTQGSPAFFSIWAERQL